MQSKFNFYSDPSHGWIKVPVSLLITLGVADKISFFSYYRKGFAYLEEDGDAALFIKEWNKVNPEKQIRFKEFSADKSSRIRNYIDYDKKQHTKQ